MESIDIKKEIGRRIKVFRKSIDFTQEKFGEKSKIHKNQISRYERGLEEPRQEILDRIVKYGGAPPDIFKVTDQVPTWNIETTEDTKFLEKAKKILKSQNQEAIKLLKNSINGIFEMSCAIKNDDENKGGD